MSVDPLYALIRSLSPEEKRAFKLQAKKYNIREGNKYLRLFDLLDSFGSYDEKKINSKIAGSALGAQVHVTRAYLMEQLLDVLVRKYESEDFNYDFQRQLAHAGALYAKGSYEAALKRIRKLASLAEKNERPLLVLQAGQLMERITIRLSDQALFEELLNVDLVRQEKAMQQQQLYLHYRKLSMQLIFLVSTQSASTLSKKQQNELRRIGRELAVQLPPAATAETAILRLGTLTLYHRYLDELDKATGYAEEALELTLNTDAGKISGGANSLINLYNNASMLLSLKGDMKRLHPLTTRVLAYAAKNKSEKLLIEERVNVSRLTQNIAFGRYEATDALVPSLTRFLAEHENELSHFSKTMIPYNIMCHYFYTGRYRQALKWMNLLVNYDFSHMTKYVLENVLLIELLLHFELQHTDLLRSRLRSNEMLMHRHNTWSPLEETLVFFLLRMADGSEKEYRAGFTQLAGELEQMKKDSTLVRRFGDFAYDTWVESHLAGKTIAKITAEKTFPEQK